MSSSPSSSAPHDLNQPHVHGPDCRHEPHATVPATFRRTAAKLGRNDPCPCGSGKKFKKCHGMGADVNAS